MVEGHNKYVNIDIIRIFAAWMVLSVHVAQRSGVNFSVGAQGVQLFFVLSGYLAFMSLDRNSSAISYYKKRLIRIIPIYYICLVIAYAEEFVLGILSSSLTDVFAGQCGPKYLRYFLFLQCFTPTNNWDLWNNFGALWTMSSFVGFYILAPHLYRFMNRFYKSLIILVALMLSRPYLITGICNIFSEYPPLSTHRMVCKQQSFNRIILLPFRCCSLYCNKRKQTEYISGNSRNYASCNSFILVSI